MDPVEDAKQQRMVLAAALLWQMVPAAMVLLESNPSESPWAYCSRQAVEAADALIEELDQKETA